ncbi:MAG TPA: hypothetical protein VGV37_20360 [Aliidongia sp.]|uniref:hypothetical protein n=1 Tax=Aliidongia sp. TaxID=1914230 RepID=UPI002DDCB251|nr:hypothetical protein [Aliidongia sp.]HEV2676892.1 hypothetical protein [Aliidongia sp.]
MDIGLIQTHIVFVSLFSEGFQISLKRIYWFVLFFSFVWYIVGVWRSADRIERRDRIWSKVAKVFIATLSLYLLGLNFAWPPYQRLQDQREYLAGDPGAGTRSVRVSEDGTTIEINGWLGRGQETVFRDILSKTSGVRTVLLNSRGGRTAIALDIEEQIRANGINTSVRGQCISSCALIFMGGREREFYRTASLGFTGLLDDDNRELISKAYLSGGFPASFVEHLRQRPAYPTWFPTYRELSDAGVVTRFVK